MKETEIVPGYIVACMNCHQQLGTLIYTPIEARKEADRHIKGGGNKDHSGHEVTITENAGSESQEIVTSATQIPVLTQARESFHSTSCPVDGKLKREGHWFCRECWKKLSDKLRGDLARMKSGWTDSWLEACAVLKGEK